MDIRPEQLADGMTLRLAEPADAPALAVAHAENRGPYDPYRPDSFFTAVGQRERLETQAREYAAGRVVPLLIGSGGRIVGAFTLSGVVLGPFRSASLGYWIAADRQGRGLATAGVERVCRIARETVGLHRLEASTRLDNLASQRVLEKSGFEPIGMAPRYLHIGGQWRDYRLFQRILHDDDPTSAF
ncbi:GNAT family protein [Streptomyces sp. W16]|uniref:GNAT family N-acetyltransferase n=1 Tax=Streptomyces sp. W16 TaxID=3076631 RepID=UPI00295C32BF|nr:GNAT family protein [Streptomyces sp. W16]MDV9178239.1 GNAT family protein [Streptomyces sp. W16]